MQQCEKKKKKRQNKDSLIEQRKYVKIGSTLSIQYATHVYLSFYFF